MIQISKKIIMTGDVLQDSECCTEHMVVSSLSLNCDRKFTSLVCMASIDIYLGM